MMSYRYHLQTADLNKDGKVDVIVRTRNDLVLLMGKGGAQFDVVDRFVPQNFGWNWMQVGDVDGDSNPDLVLFGLDIRVLFGDGAGSFARTAHFSAPVPEGSDQLRSIALLNYSSTSRVDIAAGLYNGDVAIFSMQNDRSDAGRHQVDQHQEQPVLPVRTESL